MKFDTNEIELVFFEAMQKGYASGTTPEPIDGFPGSQSIAYTKGIYTVMDTWFTAPESPCSFGQTIVWADNIPVWSMQYSGQYERDVLPFLKEALKENYNNGVFFCGRGPKQYASGNLLYVNRPRAATEKNFCRFSGIEYVYKNKTENRGWHRYQGSTLFRPNETS